MHVLCVMDYVLCVMDYVLCVIDYVLFVIDYVLCVIDYVLCVMDYVYASLIMFYASLIMFYASWIMFYWQVKQIGLEVHARMHGKPRTYRRYVEILIGLQEQGFAQWNNHWNPMGSYIIRGYKHFTQFVEIYYINLNFLPVVE